LFLGGFFYERRYSGLFSGCVVFFDVADLGGFVYGLISLRQHRFSFSDFLFRDKFLDLFKNIAYSVLSADVINSLSF